MTPLRRAWQSLIDLFQVEDAPDEIIYDPADVAAVIVACFISLGLLFWTLWALLVCEGGLFPKVIPFLRVVFTSKTLRDFGYEGYPYQMGIFEGGIVNVVALGVVGAMAGGVWRVLRRGPAEG